MSRHASTVLVGLALGFALIATLPMLDPGEIATVEHVDAHRSPHEIPAAALVTSGPVHPVPYTSARPVGSSELQFASVPMTGALHPVPHTSRRPVRAATSVLHVDPVDHLAFFEIALGLRAFEPPAFLDHAFSTRPPMKAREMPTFALASFPVELARAARFDPARVFPNADAPLGEVIAFGSTLDAAPLAQGTIIASADETIDPTEDADEIAAWDRAESTLTWSAHRDPTRAMAIPDPSDLNGDTAVDALDIFDTLRRLAQGLETDAALREIVAQVEVLE